MSGSGLSQMGFQHLATMNNINLKQHIHQISTLQD